MKIGILNYNACNLASIYHSIYRIGYDPIIINEKKELKKIDKLIIPGVGAAKSCMDYLRKKELFHEINNFLDFKKPILGICLGLQIFSKKLYEHGESEGFGFIDADVVPFKKQKINIGWSKLIINDSESFNEFSNKSFYFCHSYHLNFINLNEEKYCKGIIECGENIPSLIIKKNFIGAQFHPEKSQTNGNKFINKFLHWEPNS